MTPAAKAYYAGGFRKVVDGVPTKVFGKKQRDGSWVRAKDSPYGRR